MTGQPKVYSGNRGRDSNSVELRGHGSTRTRPLELRLDLVNHSPTGFGWGYGGSGPAQLALAILADYLGDNERSGACTKNSSGRRSPSSRRRMAIVVGLYRKLRRLNDI